MNDHSTPVRIVYFHGTAAEPDHGPSDALCTSLGCEVVRPLRPGYGDRPAAVEIDLRAVASATLDELPADPSERVVVIGWSGGGPYALAAASLGRPEIVAAGIIGSWAPMDPPHPGLAKPIRLFMRIGRWMPRPILRAALAAVGRRTPGQVDDIRRVGRPWGFAIEDVAELTPVTVWHGNEDDEVPIGPWRNRRGVEVVEFAGGHVPDAQAWERILRWAMTRQPFIG